MGFTSESIRLFDRVVPQEENQRSLLNLTSVAAAIFKCQRTSQTLRSLNVYLNTISTFPSILFFAHISLSANIRRANRIDSVKTLSTMQPTTIRPATTTDSRAVTHLLSLLGYPNSESDVESRLHAHLTEATSTVLVAEAEARVVGVLSFRCIPMFHANGFLGRITSLIVDPAFQQRGIGRALVTAAEEFGWAHGCTRVEVTSGDHRADAHAFYEKLGYLCDCRRFIKRAATA